MYTDDNNTSGKLGSVGDALRHSQSNRIMQKDFSLTFPNLASFLLMPTVDRQLDVAYFVQGEQIGFAEMSFSEFRGFGSLSFSRFYPHRFCGESLKRRGIGTLAHTSTLVHLVEMIADITEEDMICYNPFGTSDEYQALLREMNIELEECFGSHIEKAIAYAGSRGYQFNNPFLLRGK